MIDQFDVKDIYCEEAFLQDDIKYDAIFVPVGGGGLLAGISAWIRQNDKKIKIIGVGGVDSGEAAFEKIIRGASLVQLYTGMVYKGPGVVKEMKKELITILKKEKLKNISEAVGINAWPQCIQELYNTRKKLCLKDAN